MPGGSLAVLNDNDFGLLDETTPSDGTVALNPNPTPETLGIISFPTGSQIDASNRDDNINTQNWPVFSSSMPIGILGWPKASTEFVDLDDDGAYYLTARLDTALFNLQGDDNSFDDRSDDKGAEPEGVEIALLDGRAYEFIGLERIGGIMIYDVTDPNAPAFVQYERRPFEISPRLDLRLPRIMQ